MRSPVAVDVGEDKAVRFAELVEHAVQDRGDEAATGLAAEIATASIGQSAATMSSRPS
jgi:ribosomal protein S7